MLCCCRLPCGVHDEFGDHRSAILVFVERGQIGGKLIGQHRKVARGGVDGFGLSGGVLIDGSCSRNGCRVRRQRRCARGCRPSTRSANSIWSRSREVSLSMDDQSRPRRSRTLAAGAGGGAERMWATCSSVPGGKSGMKALAHHLGERGGGEIEGGRRHGSVRLPRDWPSGADAPAARFAGFAPSGLSQMELWVTDDCGLSLAQNDNNGGPADCIGAGSLPWSVTSAIPSSRLNCTELAL